MQGRWSRKTGAVCAAFKLCPFVILQNKYELILLENNFYTFLFDFGKMDTRFSCLLQESYDRKIRAVGLLEICPFVFLTV